MPGFELDAPMLVTQLVDTDKAGLCQFAGRAVDRREERFAQLLGIHAMDFVAIAPQRSVFQHDRLHGTMQVISMRDALLPLDLDHRE